ncbi:glycine-rich domain-containing protein [Telluria aromaticivorans]|uniref:Glycine-rich domain-containing protein-like n=1 Tax=Telluria aromaticivorans TaxID=2725995 RepID=A0A7Y2K0Q7_9BURK|nr:glycine-rich domain-containing protein-like [Telluria aromaticivorans]NNG24426.1 glycine-rich domain-containing protein-like [Telluria aromaticivorans]
MSTTEFALFETLDLAPIKMKLMHVESGEAWSATRTNAVEAEYRRFLFLMKKYPDAGASPTVDVDTFWHYHILDTMKYARDCEQVFGYFLHHYPYVGIGAGTDVGEQVEAGERMRAIYEVEFGASTASGSAWCAAPGKPVQAAAETNAWCAAPGKPAAAWCAAPGKQPGGTNEAAWCAAPGKPVQGAAEATAWCAAPGKQLVVSAAVASAWCAAPGKKLHAQFEATAWCAAPGKKLDGKFNATAWCAAPGKQLEDSANAWCAAPGKAAGESANEATAWCAAPGKPLPLAA